MAGLIEPTPALVAVRAAAPLQLDALDQNLLALLQTDARASAATLARQLGLPRTTVVARIARLEKSGVIAGYGVRLGAQAQGDAICAYCGLSVAPKMAPRVIEALARLPQVEEVSSVSGQFDYLAFVRCQTHAQLDGLLDHIGMIDGVRQTQTSVVLSRRIDRRSPG